MCAGCDQEPARIWMERNKLFNSEHCYEVSPRLIDLFDCVQWTVINWMPAALIELNRL